MQLEGKVAIVTGAAQGIGREIAILFASCGVKVVICDVDEEKAQVVKDEIASYRGNGLAFRVDVTDFVQVEEVVKKTVDKLGKIDILVNNAGITRDSLIMRMKEEYLDSVLNVNLKGAFNGIKAVSRPMMKASSGRIVNISSIIGIIGNIGQANYAASKAGIIGLTKAAARELAPRGINVNAIAPGFIKTSMTERLTDEVKSNMLKAIPLTRFGEPLDVAETALFLVSPASRHITGQVIQVDGGMAM